MKTASLATDRLVIPAAPALARSRFLDYLALTKPRIAVLVLFTVGAGVLLAASPEVPLAILVHAVLGTALVASGASALNQWLERVSDGQMRRTRSRPLPAGRMSALEVFLFGFTLGLGGTAYLAVALPSPLAAILAALTFVSYVGLYTPLKSITTLNTLIGAVPGAMPPVIGWCAVRGEITPEAITLFLILFLWQVPHFLAIAWMYRQEYEKAGLKMLPVFDPEGSATGRQMMLYCLALIPASLMPVWLASAGWVYAIGALALGLIFLAGSARFYCLRTDHSARRVLRLSLLYLPGLLALLVADRSLTWIS